MISLVRYARVLRTPRLGAAMLASVVGRLPMGIAGLAILLYVQGGTGSFAAAGFASALYVIGVAAIAPLIGRMIDRLGPRPLLLASALIYPIALIAMVMLVEAHAQPALIAGAALLAGGMLPPITICMRTLFPRMLEDSSLLQTAYSIDSILVESIFVAGPAIIALFVALDWRSGAVLFAAACGMAGALLFARSPAIKAWAPAATSVQKSLLGPLLHAPLRALYLATVFYSIAFGLLEVAITALATAQGKPAAAGIILALASVGSGMGALVYGSRHWDMPPQRQYVIAQLAMAAGLFIIAPVGNLYVMAALCVLACSPMAPVIALQSVLVARFAPRDMLAESFTWAATALLTGVSAGIALGGTIVESHAPQSAMLASGIATACAGLVSLILIVGAEDASADRAHK